MKTMSAAEYMALEAVLSTEEQNRRLDAEMSESDRAYWAAVEADEKSR